MQRTLHLALSVICALALSAQAAAKQYTLVELTADSAGGGTARDANNRGDVVGHRFVQTGPLPFGFTPHAYAWRNGAREDIGTPAGNSSVASSINDSGTIVGAADGHAFLWKDGQATSLQVAGTALAINNAEAIVGRYWTGGAAGAGKENPFLMRDGVLFDLPTLGGFSNSAEDINSKGDIVGMVGVGNTAASHAALWHDMAIRDLGTLGGRNSMAMRINDAGVIVGRSQAANGAWHMVRWNARGGPAESLMEGGVPWGINNRGAIVGENANTGAPFLYEDGEVTDLLQLPALKAAGWTAFTPLAITDRGWIVGNAWKPGTAFFGTALLLVPRN